MATAKTAKKAEKSGSQAVIMTGGKQYLVKAGDIVKIEKISNDIKEGDKVTFDDVLLTVDGETVTVGTPKVAGAKVAGTVKEIGRDAKVVVVHYKAKSRYFKKAGHRQPYFKVAIDSIK